jgi:transposase
MFLAYRSGGYTLNEIAEFFDVHYSTVSRLVSAYAKSKTCPLTFLLSAEQTCG